MAAGKKKLTCTYNAPVTLTFAFLSVAVLLMGYFTNGRTTVMFFEVYRSKIDVFWFIRLFGHVLGHSSVSHYAGNMMMFLLLGPILEEKYGGLNLIEAFAVVAVVSGIFNMIFFPDVALLGASGLVFMMIVLVSASDLRASEIPITMILVIIIYLGSEILTMITAHDNISQLTHIIGGICGAIFGVLLNGKK
ncbi:MAG: rhomboid family intramembrane serine protease [Eubacterium sp.]|nr:rhomboid family intramembrane serine protease [Eubacterium sp.]